jgi:negative regulator of sigma-B (phosphoserine phosphatase)
MTLASVHSSDATLTWLGVGNVEGRLLRPRAGTSPQKQNALLLAGVVGYQLPALHAGVGSLQKGDLLILATDGIHARFAEGLRLDQAPRQIAAHILDRHLKGNDDALVLVARYLGGAA